MSLATGVELDLSNGHAIVTIVPLAASAELYRQKTKQSLELIKKNRAIIQKGKLAETDAVEALRANREERDKEIE